MGSEWLNRVITALENGGILSREGYPAGPMPHLTGPVAAVMLEQVDYGQNRVTVGVRIYSPANLGGPVCRDMAEVAGTRIRDLGMACVQEGIVFDSLTDCFYVPLRATYIQPTVQTPAFTVELDSQVLSHVVSFQVKRDEDPELEITFPGAYWYISIEEVFGPEDGEPVVTEDSFQLKVTRPKSVETYENCTWSSILREHDGQVLRRVRTAKTTSRSIVAAQ